MSENRTFYRLWPMMDGCDLTRDAEDIWTRIWKCSGCGSAKPDMGAIDVQIDDSRINDGPINFVDPCGLALKSFLDQMGSETVERDLYLGRVSNDDGELLDDWVTFHGRREVAVRGCDDLDDDNARVQWSYCGICGRLRYSASGREYLYPAPPSDAEIFDDDGVLIVPDYLFAKLEIPSKANVRVDKLEVVGEPLDGFGQLEYWNRDRSQREIRHESKRGIKTLNDIPRGAQHLRSIESAVESVRRGDYRKVVWHFFSDAKTGCVEVSKQLLAVLDDAGIEYVIHE